MILISSCDSVKIISIKNVNDFIWFDFIVDKATVSVSLKIPLQQFIEQLSDLSKKINNTDFSTSKRFEEEIKYVAPVMQETKPM